MADVMSWFTYAHGLQTRWEQYMEWKHTTKVNKCCGAYHIKTMQAELPSTLRTRISQYGAITKATGATIQQQHSCHGSYSNLPCSLTRWWLLILGYCTSCRFDQHAGPPILVPINYIDVNQHVKLLSGGTYWTLVYVQA